MLNACYRFAMRRAQAFAIFVLFLLVAASRNGSSAPAPGLSITRARLVKELDTRKVQAGSGFYLTTTALWQNGDCVIRANTMVYALIVHLQRHGDGKKDELGIRFEELPCYGSETAKVSPLLAAMRGPEAQDAGNDLQKAEMKQAMSAMLRRSPMTPAGGAPGIKAVNPANQGLTTFTANVQYQDTSGISTGEVKNIHGVKIELPARGSDVTTVVSSHEIDLQPGTEFFLVFVTPSGITTQEAAQAAPVHPVGGPEEKLTQTPAPDDGGLSAVQSSMEEAKLCGSNCVRFSDDLNAVSEKGSADAWRLSLAAYGLRPRMQQVRVDLDDDASVHFLGEDEILVTINPHGLTRRSPDAGQRPRVIRAMVLSRQDGRLLQEQEWPVYDERQYTWDLGDGRVLAHIGRELVILGPGLTAEYRYRLLGPVVFSEVAPASGEKTGDTGGLIVVATLHEKHTLEAHRQMAAYLGQDWPIDEDYDLTVLNAKLELIGTRRLDGRPPQTALLNTGMVAAERDHGQSWKVQREGWDGKVATLTRLSSGCAVKLSTIPGPLLFATVCAGDRSTTSYYLLSQQGVVLVEGHSPGTQLLQQAVSDASGDVVAIAQTESYEPIDLGVGARIADFRRLNVSVYRVSDGKKLLTARSDEGSALRQTFALSPSGNSLAMLSGSTMQVYSLASHQHPVVADVQPPR